jgi:hypothetical protein
MNLRVERMPSIRLVAHAIPIRTGDEEAEAFELLEFLLHRPEAQPGTALDLPKVERGVRQTEQQAKHLGASPGGQEFR